jgi:cell division protein FtsB
MTKKETARTQVRAVSSRAGILSVLVLLILVSLAIPIKNLLDQQSRISQLQQRQEANVELISKLQDEVKRWQDPAFVRAQARARLHYVMPGEVGYIVLEAEQVPQVLPSSQMSITSSSAWYSTMWRSLEDAGNTAAPLQIEE